MTHDQDYGHRLFDRIQKQPPTREAGNHFRTSGRSQRTQAGVSKLA
jgi:hypothetical protein